MDYSFNLFCNLIKQNDFSFSFFRRRTVTLILAAITVLVVSGVVVGLFYGLKKRKKSIAPVSLRNECEWNFDLI